MSPRPKLRSNALIAPSLLSADFAHLGDEVGEAMAAGADWLHVDVMDGHFVPNLTVGPIVVEAIRPMAKVPLDCHLMVKNPEAWVEPFAKAGADIITVHAEATVHLDRLIHHIRESKCKAGVSINPATSLSAIEEVLDIVDLVLVMSVNPGFGGQKFIAGALDKVHRLAAVRGRREFMIEVDGGINEANAREIRKAGCDVFVAGSAIFGQPDRKKALRELRASIGD